MLHKGEYLSQIYQIHPSIQLKSVEEEGLRFLGSNIVNIFCKKCQFEEIKKKRQLPVKSPEVSFKVMKISTAGGFINLIY